MEVTTVTEVTVGTAVRLAGQMRNPDGSLTDPSEMSWLVRDPSGVEADMTARVVHDGEGMYHLDVSVDTAGDWYWKVSTDLPTTVAAGSFTCVDPYTEATDPQNPTDLRALVPRVRRYCEGPYGPAPGKQPLTEQQLYAMAADGFSDIIMFCHGLFPRKLVITQRDLRVGFPTGWSADAPLTDWEESIIVTQVALNYWYFSLRDMRTSVSVGNEGTTYTYTTSVNIIRDYIKSLQGSRDAAVETLRMRYPALDRYVSNIRVRDQATVGILEWWDTNSPSLSGGIGMPGGQEAAVMPWLPGWYGGGTP